MRETTNQKPTLRCRPTNGLTEVRQDPSLLQMLCCWRFNSHKDHPMQEGASELSTVYFPHCFWSFYAICTGMLMRALGSRWQSTSTSITLIEVCMQFLFLQSIKGCVINQQYLLTRGIINPVSSTANSRASDVIFHHKKPFQIPKHFFHLSIMQMCLLQTEL